MKEHYGFSDTQLSELKTIGIGLSELFKLTKEFQAGQPDLSPITKISLMLYVDRHGDFSELKSKQDHVAMMVFKNLSEKEKLEIIQYISDVSDELGDDDEWMPEE